MGKIICRRTCRRSAESDIGTNVFRRGAAVLTDKGNVYTGVCIDTDCSLGMCAERNALSTMITNGEYAAKKVIAVTKMGEILPPCGACREFMMQLGSPENIEILVDSDAAVTLKDLMPYPY